MPVDIQQVAIDLMKERVAAAEEAEKHARLRVKILRLALDAAEGKLTKAELIDKMMDAIPADLIAEVAEDEPAIN